MAQSSLLSNDVHRLLPVDGTAGPGVLQDLDADGDLDLVIGSRLLFNDGRGVFRGEPQPLPASFQAASCYAAGDLDGDLDLDLVLGTANEDEVWLNPGGGWFSGSPQTLPTVAGAHFTNSVALGDVDGDGDLDIVMSNVPWEGCNDECPPGNLRLFLNSGHAAFSDASAQIPAQDDAFPGAVALGDVDGDLDLDLLVANLRASPLFAPHRLFTNDGAGFFTLTAGQVPFGIGQESSRISATFADFDADLDLDILIGSTALWSNAGSGTFVDASTSLPAHAADSRAAVGDADGDGDLDILACSAGSGDSLLLNAGGAAFVLGGQLPATREPTRLALFGDVDIDGDLDLVLGRSTQAELALNEGDARFIDVPPLLPAEFGYYNHSVAVGDVNGDGLADVLASYEYRDRLWLNAGNGAFVDATANLPAIDDMTMAVALVDIDRDGDLDGLFANDVNYASGPDHICLNDGQGQFTLAPGMWNAPLDSTSTMAVSDVDGDDDLDVFTGNDQGQPNRLYFNDGAGQLAEIPGKWPTGSTAARSAAFGDLDDDGDGDAVLGEQGAKLFMNDGTGGFTEVPGALFNANSVTMAVALGDLDADGDLDVVVGSNWASGLTRTVRMFTNDGAGAFTEDLARLPDMQDYTSALALADFDGDGDLDLVRSSNPAQLLLNDGQGYFIEASGPPPGVGYSFALVPFDTDVDGDLDLVCAQGLGHARVLVNNTRQLAWHTLPRIGSEQRFELQGKPYRGFRFVGSYATSWIPMQNVGVLRVARLQMFHAAFGTLDATGRRRVSWTVPLDPNLIGRSFYWQALIAGPAKLTNLEITTFLPR